MTDEVTSEETETYESWTKEQLHDELANRGLLVSGTKDEQITRLEEDDAQAETEDVDEPEAKSDEVEADQSVPAPRVPPEGPVLTVEQETELNRLQADYPHEYVTVEWDDKGNPTFVTPDGESHKSKA